MNELKTAPEEKPSISPLQMMIRFLFTGALMFGVLFLSAGTLRWWEGWVYIGVNLALLVYGRWMLYIKNPSLVNERVQAGGL